MGWSDGRMVWESECDWVRIFTLHGQDERVLLGLDVFHLLVDGLIYFWVTVRQELAKVPLASGLMLESHIRKQSIHINST